MGCGSPLRAVCHAIGARCYRQRGQIIYEMKSLESTTLVKPCNVPLWVEMDHRSLLQEQIQYTTLLYQHVQKHAQKQIPMSFSFMYDTAPSSEIGMLFPARCATTRSDRSPSTGADRSDLRMAAIQPQDGRRPHASCRVRG
jgi:hypothetical protein